MKSRVNLFLLNGLLITLAVTFSTLLFLAEIRSEAEQLASTEQEEAIRTFWQILRRRGTDFRVVDGRLMAGEYVVNGNHELPDRIREIFGGTATIFMGDTRVATNVLTEDGRRATGTRLIGPAHDAIFRENRPYRGEAPILGIPYFTAYDPIRDRNGKTIGILYVGVKKSEFLTSYNRLKLNMIAGIAAIELLFLAISFALLRERNRHEDALQAQLGFLQTLIDTIPSPIFYKDRRGRYLGYNRAFEDSLGLTRDQLIGKTVYDVAPKELADRYSEMDEALFAKPGVQVYDSSVFYADGTRHEVIFNKATFTDKYGAVGGLVGVILDVTERKRAEEALKESEERFHQIYAQNWDAVILFRLDNFAISDANPAALHLFGLTRSEMIGLTPRSLVESEDFRKLIDMVPLDDHSSSFQLDRAVAFRQDGTGMTVSIRAKVLRLREEYVVYCSFRDITERVRMEEEIRNTQARLIHTNKMTSLGMLASSIAHEINNPNNFISVNASMLADAWGDAATVLGRHRDEHGDFPLGGLPFSEMAELVPRLFAGITEGSRRISAIVANMKGYVKGGDGGPGAEFNVNDAVQDAATMLWHHIHKYTDAFMLSLADDLPPARGSRQQIEQVVVNLIMNALQALPDRDAFVSAATFFDRQAGLIMVTIRDEGRGMGEDVLQRLTEPFFTTRSGEGGTGLGLYISASIVREHGGSLEFDSAPGRGTAVTVRLPAASSLMPCHRINTL